VGEAKAGRSRGMRISTRGKGTVQQFLRNSTPRRRSSVNHRARKGAFHLARTVKRCYSQRVPVPIFNFSIGFDLAPESLAPWTIAKSDSVCCAAAFVAEGVNFHGFCCGK
jgi:hypothetical protein